MNIISIKKHLAAIDKLLDSSIIKLSDVEKHLNFVNAFSILTFNIPAGTHVFRATTSFKDEYFTQISRIWYPPKSEVKHYARLNTPGQSLFYCSEDEVTPLLELINYWVQNISPGHCFHVTMGEWEIVENIESIVVVSPNKALRRSQFEISSGNAYDHHRGTFTPEQQEVSHEFYGKFHDWYSRRAGVGNDIYKVTSCLSNKLIRSSKQIGLFKNVAISYPSVAFERGVNFAFEPKIVASGKLKLVRVWRLKLVVNINENGFYNFKEVGREYGSIEQDNSIKWDAM